MLIEIPDLTPEMCEARAESLRKMGWTPEALRARAALPVGHVAATYPFDAALLEQYPARPELKVGDLAMDSWRADRVRVDHIGKRRAFYTTARGSEGAARICNLTPLGEPAPDDWGQG